MRRDRSRRDRRQGQFKARKRSIIAQSVNRQKGRQKGNVELMPKLHTKDLLFSVLPWLDAHDGDLQTEVRDGRVEQRELRIERPALKGPEDDAR